MTVMVYGYSGLLISCLTVPTWTKPIETLEDVAASKEVILRIPTDGMGGLSKAVTVSYLLHILTHVLLRIQDAHLLCRIINNVYTQILGR